jgi:ubiquinone/menaquinone biosynthesis C-methylase UbiE
MAYYDSIARQWHKATGYRGGEFKRLVLNDVLLESIPDIDGRSILELGAGNGYFMPLVLRKYSGKNPARVVITDQSSRLIETAKKNFSIENAEYRILNVAREFPFVDGSFDIILATMIFNEVPTGVLRKALAECSRVLENGGLFLITVTHPDFINSLRKRSLLKRGDKGVLTMPGAGGLRLPVVVRKVEFYRRVLEESGFNYEEQSIYPTEEVLNAKPGLRNAGNIPLALMFRCVK